MIWSVKSSGIPTGLATSKQAPVSDKLRTTQSTVDPPNTIDAPLSVRTRGLARFSVIQCEVEAVREVPPVKRLYKRAPESGRVRCNYRCPLSANGGHLGHWLAASSPVRAKDLNAVLAALAYAALASSSVSNCPRYFFSRFTLISATYLPCLVFQTPLTPSIFRGP